MNQFELHQFVALWKPPTQRYIDIAYEECEHQLENDCLINQCRNLHAFATNKNINTMNFQQISLDFIDCTTVYDYFKLRRSNQTVTKP